MIRCGIKVSHPMYVNLYSLCTEFTIMVFEKHLDDHDNRSDGKKEGQTADEHQQPSQQRSAHSNKSIMPRVPSPAGEHKKAVKSKKKAFHAPYQKLTPIATDHIQSVEMEISDCVAASTRNPTCVDVPVSILPL
jgi:hypothetical protein